MDLGLRDRIVVVTGASKGIGFACAQAFAGEGARVALVSRSRSNLDAALAKIQHVEHQPVSFVADLADAAHAIAMVDDVESTLGPIDVLVSSAGAAKRYPPDVLSPAAPGRLRRLRGATGQQSEHGSDNDDAQAHGFLTFNCGSNTTECRFPTSRRNPEFEPWNPPIARRTPLVRLAVPWR